MWVYPGIDPIAFNLGPVAIHWYGLAYLLGFLLVRWIGVRAVQSGRLSLTKEAWDDGLFYGMLAAILGGRLGYMLVYGWASWKADPWSIFAVWHGGMSFHGGVIGAILGLWLYAYRRRQSMLLWTDFSVCYLPICLGLGRLANFVNGELWGRVVEHEVPWAIIYPHVDLKLRHPSQLYEVLGEGLLLFVFMQLIARCRRWSEGWLTLWFIWAYGAVRAVLEVFREPDAQMGFFAGLTMGQWLSLGMVALASLVMLLLWVRDQRDAKQTTTSYSSTATEGDKKDAG